MSRSDTPEEIAASRMVSATAVLQGRVDLRGYPYRHLVIASQDSIGPGRVSHVVAAAEVLGQYGWSVINVAEFSSSRIVYAFLRR